MNSLGSLDPKAVATVLAAASDLALVIDERGVIQDMSFQSEQLARDLGAHPSWLGQAWIDTVTIDSRPKVEALLRDAEKQLPPRWRHLNHQTGRDSDRPILYSAARLGSDGQMVAFGRDLRPAAELQQRLVDAQQSLEQDYANLRHVEMRYRLLFQASSEAVLILDAATLKVTEANPAAVALFGDHAKRLQARGLLQAIDAASAEPIQAMFNTARVAGRSEEIRAKLGSGHEVILSASLFREGSAAMFLVRLAAVSSAAGPSEPKSRLLQMAESAPDGFVVIGPDRRIVTANAAFLELVQLPSEEAVRGQSLDRWLGRNGVDLDVLVANLRQRGAMRHFATIMRGEFGVSTNVEISANTMTNSGPANYGLVIRDVGRRLSAEAQPELPYSAGNLSDLVGRVPMKELVRQSTDVIERLSIEMALKLTGDNRASAAEMLGLSRQSFYVKLRRYGLGDLSPDDSDLG
jgi:transcriptional regulator PpsR